MYFKNIHTVFGNYALTCWIPWNVFLQSLKCCESLVSITGGCLQQGNKAESWLFWLRLVWLLSGRTIIYSKCEMTIWITCWQSRFEGRRTKGEDWKEGPPRKGNTFQYWQQKELGIIWVHALFGDHTIISSRNRHFGELTVKIVA